MIFYHCYKMVSSEFKYIFPVYKNDETFISMQQCHK